MRAMSLRALLLLVSASLAATGCNKPSEEDCRRAVLNLQKVRGIDTSPQAPDPAPAVRRCRSGASKETVQCLINAKTAAEADRCAPKHEVN
jgi:hypothetical protein